MDFDLIGHDRRAGKSDRFPHLGDILVADADEAGFAGGFDSAQHFDLLRDRHLVARPMQQQEIDAVGLELVETLVDRGGELLVAVIVDPDLRGQEQLVSSCTGGR
jgi:hypothetical protein